MKHRVLLLLTLLMLSTPCINADNIELRARHLTANDGVPGNTVRYVYQDSKGFLWMGTLNGLSRYDGNSFLTFQPEPEKPGQISLADNRINKIDEDTNGFLWVRTFPELYSCYDLQNARFVDYTGCGELKLKYSSHLRASNGDIWLWHKGNGVRRVRVNADRSMSSEVYKEELGNLPNDKVLFATEDTFGRIWVATQGGLVSIHKGESRVEIDIHDFKFNFIHEQEIYFVTTDGDLYNYDVQAKEVKKIAVLPKVSKSLTLTGCVPLKDKCIFLTSAGAYDYNFKTHKITVSVNQKIKGGIATRDNQGDYWIYNHTGHVYYIPIQTGIIKELDLMPQKYLNYIDYERYRFVHDSRGIIWISTYGNGLFAYDPNNDTLEHFTAENNVVKTISSNTLLYVMEDKAGGIWVCTEFSGLSRLTIANKGIARFYPENKDLTDRSNSIRMLTQTDNGDFLIGNRMGGLYTYDSQLKPKGEKQSFQSSIYAVSKDAHGKLWLGTRGTGVKVGDSWIRRNPNDPSSIAHSHIFSLYCDKKDRMWIGTFGGGLDLAEPVGDGQYKFIHFLQYTTSMREVRTITEDKNGMMWVGTDDGLCIFHPDSLIANPENYHLFNLTNGKFCSNGIKYILRDSKDRMWVGTSGKGLILCKTVDGYASLKYESYSMLEGLVNNSVQTIIEDRDGLLWVGTEHGISKFNPDNLAIENYFFSSHSQGNIYTESSGCLCDDGRLLFATEYGLTLIDPKLVPSNNIFSPVVFTSLSINGVEMSPEMENYPLTQSVSYSDKVTLKYFQNSIVLKFSTLDYSDSRQIQYKYWLENYEHTWNKPSSLSFAAFKYLEPGTYKLHVKACNGAGIWNDEETILEIVVTPPFWKTSWAILCYVLLMGIALYFAFRITHNFSRLRNRIDVEKQLTEYKLVFFTNISHEFRTPLTLIQGALEKIQRLGNVPHELEQPLHSMNKSSQRLLRLVNQLLEFRKMQNSKLALSLEETDVIIFLNEIYLNFKEVADQKKMDFRFLSSISSYQMFIDKGFMDKVVYNLLSNAFKYTPIGGQVLFSVCMDETKNTLQIQVTDTGVGIPKEKQGELFNRFMQSSFARDSIGVGLHLSHELMQVHKGTITFKENEGGGSVFTVTLPTDKNIYEEKDFLIPGNVLLKEADTQATWLSESLDTHIPYAVSAIPLNKRKVLIIEDDNDIREYLKEEFGNYFEVETAADGISGFEEACNYDADLIICDVLMPGMSGFEVTKKLKSDFSTSHIPIILLTALNSSEKQLEGIEAGADAYISKPFSSKLLLARAFQLIRQRDMLREKFSNEPGIVHAAMCTTDRDKEFADRLSIVLERHLSQPDFTVDEFALLMKMGRTLFYKKLRGITGYTPNEYLRVMRMKKAAELLLSEERFTVAEVTYKVGINDPFYFSRCFKNHFGISPSVYQKGGKPVEEEA